jgi:hypothetical protein
MSARNYATKLQNVFQKNKNNNLNMRMCEFKMNMIVSTEAKINKNCDFSVKFLRYFQF